MNQDEGNYQQNFHYQNLQQENYDNGYTNEYGDFVQNYAPLGLEVPNTRLYSDNNVPVYEEAPHLRNSNYYHQPQPLDFSNNADVRYLNSAAAAPTEYYNNEAYQTNYQNKPAQATYSQAKSKFSHIKYDNNQYVYPTEESSHNYYDGYHDNNDYVNGNCKYCEYKKTYYPDLYQMELQRAQAAKESEYHHAEDSRKKFYNYGKKAATKTTKKYPVTVKMSKYVKNSNPTMVNKRPSALCLPLVTQPLARRKSKTNQQFKKNSHPQSEGFYENENHPQNVNYSAHKMHSQGDVKNLDGIENLLDTLENQPDETYEEGPQSLEAKNKIKELTKFLKPRVPSSIRCKQQQQTVESEPKPSYQPRLKLSLDKLLTRLQKCETTDDIVNEFSPRSSKTEILSPKQHQNSEADKKKGDSVKSYNYEELSKKCPQKQDEKKEDLGIRTVHKATMNQLQSSEESLENKKTFKSLDDNCALDLHRSKSYIVDLIDKALSKELGTVPRGQSIHHNLSPHQAITTISRHRQKSNPNCYELSAKLADSFTSNASAPVEGSSRMVFEKSASDGQIKPKSSDLDCYVKQLKHLRWGHIRHIQNEAKKLADLEEFLENCGEISD